MRASKKAKPELKPCKHCGRKPTLRRFDTLFTVPHDIQWQVACRCGIRTKLYTTRSGAVKAWNREDKSQSALLRAAKALVAHCDQIFPDCARCVFWNRHGAVPDCMFRFGSPQVWDVPEEESNER